MKKILTLALALALAIGVQAQYVEFYKNDGTKLKYPTNALKSVEFQNDFFKTATLNRIDDNTEELMMVQVDSVIFDEHDKVLNGYPAVDLGLPSGLLWASMNVGANSPEEYGTYFGWGEVTTKDAYSWATYRWGDGTLEGKTKEQRKYNVLDGKVDLDPEDDAATVNWGGQWRMPLPDDFIELRENCTVTNETINDIKGIRMTSKNNGESIFLPLGGYIDSQGEYMVGDFGMYWTKSKFFASKGEGVTLGYAIDFFAREYDVAKDRTEGVYYEYTDRYYAETVRAVCENNIERPAAESISLDKNEVTLQPRETVQLTKTILPAEALQSAIWTSADETVAKVSNDGLVTAVGVGQTTITVAAKSNPALTAKCVVKVEKAPSPVATDVPVYLVHSASGLYLSLDILTGAPGTQEHNASLQEMENGTILYIHDNENGTFSINTAVDQSGKYMAGSTWNTIPSDDAFAWDITKMENGKYNLYQSTSGNPGYLKADPVDGPWNVGAATYCNCQNPVEWEIVPASAEVWSVTTDPENVGGIVLTGGTKVANGGKFAFEGTPQEGTDFTVEEVVGYQKDDITISDETKNIFVHYVTAETTYTVTVIGHEDGGILLENGTEVKNGGTFTFEGVPELDNDYVLIDIAGYSVKSEQKAQNITVTYTEITDKYPICFDVDQTYTYQGRYLKAVKLDEQSVDVNYNGGQTVGQVKCYQDLTKDDTKVFTVTAGASVVPAFDWVGYWMMGFVFLDKNNDGSFEGDLVSQPAASTDEHARCLDTNPKLPAFTVPTTPGEYRLRFKIDWDNTDPAGNTGADGNPVTGNNGIIKNGGSITDVILRVVE